jgi:hypothetical protein
VKIEGDHLEALLAPMSIDLEAIDLAAVVNDLYL